MIRSGKIALSLLAATTAPVFYYLYRIYKYNLMPRYSTEWTMSLHDSTDVKYSGKHLGYYYGDFSRCLHDYTFDKDGIIAYAKPDIGNNLFHNATAVAEYAIIQYEKFLRTGEDKYSDEFRKNVDWLVDNATPINDDKACFYYLYDTPEEKAPWGSGIAQGISISALLRASQHFKEPHYFQLAERAFNMLDAPVQEGGFRFSEEQFNLWYEEDNHCGHILNGHIYALLGVFDLYRVTQNELYRQKFLAGVQTIKDNIWVFDMGFNTKYGANSSYPANTCYHSIHINLFYILYRITNDIFFLNCADRFSDYHYKNHYKMRTFQHIIKLTLLQKIKGGSKSPT